MLGAMRACGDLVVPRSRAAFDLVCHWCVTAGVAVRDVVGGVVRAFCGRRVDAGAAAVSVIIA